MSVIEYIYSYFRWLDYLLSRIVYQAKAFVMNAERDRDKVAKKMERINNRLSAIESEQSKVVEDLRKHLKAKIDEAVQKLSIFLESDEVRTRFTSWNLDEVPEIEVSWQVTENNINKALQTRLREIIEHWEEDERVFTDARDSLLHYFRSSTILLRGKSGICKKVLRLMTQSVFQKLIPQLKAFLWQQSLLSVLPAQSGFHSL